MIIDALRQDRIRRKGILLGVAALHAAAVCLWLGTGPRVHAPDAGTPTVFLQLLKLQPPRVQPPVAVTPPPPPAVQPRRPTRPASAPSAVALPDDAPSAASAAEPITVPPAEASSAADAGIDAIVTQGKRDAVAFDRATNKDRLKGITSFDNRPFARAIAGAFKPRTGITTTREYVSNDGRRITKVISPHGTYCVISLENNTIMSESLSRQGASTRKIACPSDE